MSLGESLQPVFFFADRFRPHFTRPNMDGKTMNENQTAAQPELPVLLSARETADVLKLTVQTLRKWRRTGRGPDFCYVSRRVRYPVASVRKWLDARMRAVEH